MTIYDYDVRALDGGAASLRDFVDQAVLIVNVASRCMHTPQYAGLEQLYERYRSRGFAVLGFPCNQFRGQEPGTAQEIAAFCASTYGVTFPMFAKVEVNGPGRHPLFGELTRVADSDGDAGDVQWNFEKFLVAPDGTLVTRFRPGTQPDAPELLEAIEKALPRA